MTMRAIAVVLASILACAGLRAADTAANESLQPAIEKALLDYTRQIETATRKLTETRERVARERGPLDAALREAETRIRTLQADITRLETVQAQAEERSQQLRVESTTLDRNLAYIGNLGLDRLRGFESGLRPGETDWLHDRIALLSERLEHHSHDVQATATLDVTELLLQQVRRELGGYSAPGTSLVAGDNRLIDGTFVFLGPEVLFAAKDGSVAGTARAREDSEHAITYPLPDWPADRIEQLIAQGSGQLLMDATGGKALRLHETKGTWWDRIHKGGPIAYVIIGLGAVSVLITLLKLGDIRQLALDDPLAVHRVTSALARGARAEAENAVKSLRRTTRELLSTGLRHLDGPRQVLEEQFEAFVLQQRLHQERRLPLLAVIATAGPLLGLLGTVTGMIKTFTLITIFGTGNAGRLSGGISEALVATELGLTVAIPTLIVHGFLAHRIHKNLALLERYAIEFVSAAEEARSRDLAEPFPGA